MNDHPILIKNGRIPDTKSRKWIASDILINDGVISSVGNIAVKKGYTVYDARGNVIFPKFTDLRTHIYVPPYIRTEKTATTLRAALTGGFGRILTAPKAPVPISDAGQISAIKSEAAKSGCELLVAASLTDANGNTADIESLFDAGAFAIADDGDADDDILLDAMKYCAEKKRPVIIHADDKQLSAKAAHTTTYGYGRKSGFTDKTLSEDIATAHALLLAAKSGCRLHISGVSSACSVNLISQAKKSGISVTCDTSPQYFSMTSDDLLFYGNNVKLHHPLRSVKDRDAIADAIADGTIDAISSDHTAVTSEEKNVSFEKASCGMLGLQTAFPISLCSLVCTEKIDLYRLYELLSKAPAEIVGKTAEIKVGAPASFAVCDIDSEYTFEQSMLVSDRLVSNSPYLGQVLIGKVLKLF